MMKIFLVVVVALVANISGMPSDCPPPPPPHCTHIMPPPPDCPPPPPPHCRQQNNSGMPSMCPPLPPAPSCLDNEVMCPPRPDHMGCMMPPMCRPQLMGYDMIMAGVAITIDVPCPIPEMCPPPMCGPGQMRCFAEPSVDGCNPIASCEPASNGNCPAFCPMTCPEGQVPCGPVAGADGCMMPPMCAMVASDCPGFGK